MKKFIVFLCSILLVLGTAGVCDAIMYGGVDFPEGAVSFADSVFSFDPVIKSGQPAAVYLDPLQALGIPNYMSI